MEALSEQLEGLARDQCSLLIQRHHCVEKLSQVSVNAGDLEAELTVTRQLEGIREMTGVGWGFVSRMSLEFDL